MWKNCTAVENPRNTFYYWIF